MFVPVPEVVSAQTRVHRVIQKNTSEPLHERLLKFQARIGFLQAVEAHAPEVLDDLSKAPYQNFVRAGLASQPPIKIWGYLSSGAIPHLGPPIPRFNVSLRLWAGRWNITTPWLLECAYFTLYRWAQDPQIRWPECRKHGKSPWYYGSFGYTLPLPPSPPEGTPTYDLWESREQYLNELDREAKRRIKADLLLSAAHRSRQI